MKLLKVPYEKPQDIFSLYEPKPEIVKLSENAESPYDLITEASKNSLFSDVIIFLAHGLPVREAVWWAANCASSRTDWNEHEQNAIRAAKAWVHTPDETSRRFAEEMVKLAGLESGAGWAAQAAFWSGGSMIEASAPIVAPPAYIYSQAVAGCINLTAVLPDASQAIERYKTYLDIGINIAFGGNGQS
ncbi:Twin-arginine translocation pathway signal [Parashewanella spongiae]|uniref:Twin-arginine translocation pathway signal n=1 Tax=Parashewanella spongiae TaxID=342950 RepID=A0A3A6TTW1_9GAMM|nr:Twin-arginine translocation pathway signal [Parashewanella spongiae]MCL1078183.1 Twin-arginine translocation pathway signal [Parashewanella spongiae]RJY14883.1 Twin-arginine translocation pathway signal [Parashewanella spongiae]